MRLGALPKVFEVGLHGCWSQVFITSSACTLLIPKFILYSSLTTPVCPNEWGQPGGDRAGDDLLPPSRFPFIVSD